MTFKHSRLLLVFIIFFGFILRYQAAVSIPIVWDEKNHDFPVAEDISLNIKKLNIPLVGEDKTTPITFRYIIYFGWKVFGKTLLGARLPFVILGTSIILLVYLFTKITFGVKTALLASFLTSISQYCIGISRTADLNVTTQFIFILSLFLFYKAMKNADKNLILFNGLVMGVGFWFRENIFFLIPIYVIFLLSCPKYRSWLKDKYLWISFIISFILASPLLYLMLDERVKYFHEKAIIGFSLNAVSLYLGELFLLSIKPFSEFFKQVAASLDMSYPPANFVFGIIILIAVVKSIKRKQPFVRLFLVSFLFNFIVFSFIRRNDDVHAFWNLGSLNWSDLAFLPGIILASDMLMNFLKKRTLRRKILFWFLMIFICIRTYSFVKFPLSAFFPVKDFLIVAHQYDAECAFEEGNIDEAKDVFKRIYRITDEGSVRKKNAALKLSEILIKEGNYKEAAKYLYYLALQHPNDDDIQEVLEQPK
ncbi:MAG: glycosyltransferase family 39 protein [Candidatus Omnitrophica bacterium]|nr:glycosyltransferase family 39 protein [Candidatus Omnitrophota bacterium]